MNYLKEKSMKKNLVFFNFILLMIICLVANIALSKDFLIKGNKYSDDEVIISLIGKIPDIDDKSKSNYSNLIN